jgi:hypothetical protein
LKRKHAHNVTPLTVFKLFTNYESDAPPPLHSSFAASIPSSWFTDIIATFVHEANVDFQQLSQHRLNERYVQYLTAADLFDLLYDPPVISSQTSPQQSSQNLAGTSSTTNVRASISLPSPSNVPPLNFAFLTPTSSTTTNMTHSKSMFTFDPSSVQNTGAAEPESKPKCDQTASPKWVEYLSFRKVPVGILQKLPAAFTAHSKPTAETIPSKPTPINTNGSNKPSLNKVIAATSASVASVSTSTSSSAFLTAPVHFTVVRAHWTPKHITLDQRRNKLPLRQVTSQSSSPHLRCVTYDGAPAASEFRVLPLSATHRNARLGHSAAKVRYLENNFR